MEAPEKINISIVPSAVGGYTYITCSKEFPHAVEYIRADVFIEKAVKFLCSCIEDEMARHLETWHPDMKAKTIERFKNYMKG